MDIINVENAYMHDTPDARAIAETARGIIAAATTHETDVTAVVTKHDDSLTVHHNHHNRQDVNTLSALAALTQDLAHQTRATVQEVSDMTLRVVEESSDDDTHRYH